MYGDDMIVEVTRHEPFKMSITTDGVSISVHSQGGFIEGLNGRGDMRIQSTKETENPIIKDFSRFCNRMMKKYGQKCTFPFPLPKKVEKTDKAKSKQRKGGRK